MKLINNRIKTVRTGLKMSQTEFAERLGVTGGAVSRWEVGDREVPDIAIRSICREFHINETWLRTGVGEMMAPRSRADEMSEFVSQYLAESSESFRSALITAMLRLDPEGPEWEVLENIYKAVEAKVKNPPEP